MINILETILNKSVKEDSCELWNRIKRKYPKVIEDGVNYIPMIISHLLE